MKNLLLLSFAIGMMISSCGDSTENASEVASAQEAVDTGNKSYCDCVKIATDKPEVEEIPAGCEWLGELSEEADEKALKAALKDCPDNFPEGFADQMSEMMDAVNQLEDIADDFEDDLDDMGSE